MLVLTTLGSAERRGWTRRRGRAVERAEPEPPPTARATVVRPEQFASQEAAAAWLADLCGDRKATLAEVEAALRVVNRALRAHRAAAADPYAAEVAGHRSLVTRLGYGRGETVAKGRFGEGFELPRAGTKRVKRSMAAPDERFAALLGGRERALVAEELVLRARADLDAERPREAALQARVALAALLAELSNAELSEWRGPVSEAANDALNGEPRGDAVEQAVEAMEAVLRRHRLGA